MVDYNLLKHLSFNSEKKMTQKKISGYTIFLDKLLGKGSYGAV